MDNAQVAACTPCPCCAMQLCMCETAQCPLCAQKNHPSRHVTAHAWRVHTTNPHGIRNFITVRKQHQTCHDKRT
eukprot:7238331-Prymnesium_polylepis.2